MKRKTIFLILLLVVTAIPTAYFLLVSCIAVGFGILHGGFEVEWDFLLRADTLYVSSGREGLHVAGATVFFVAGLGLPPFMMSILLLYRARKKHKLEFFLDTGALIALSGLKDSDLQDFRNGIEASTSELTITHVQVDESTEHINFHEKSEKHEKTVSNYRQKIDKALEALNNKGINVSLEDTKITVVGVSRFDHTKLGYEEMHKFDDELRKEIDECEKARGKTKILLNIARDTTIAISSLGHDFFITCDRCLFESWRKVIKKHRKLGRKFKIPRIVYVRRSPENVAKEMLALFP